VDFLLALAKAFCGFSSEVPNTVVVEFWVRLKPIPVTQNMAMFPTVIYVFRTCHFRWWCLGERVWCTVTLNYASGVRMQLQQQYKVVQAIAVTVGLQLTLP
jgi:hypothetical protein